MNIQAEIPVISSSESWIEPSSPRNSSGGLRWSKAGADGERAEDNRQVGPEEDAREEGYDADGGKATGRSRPPLGGKAGCRSVARSGR